MTNNKKQRWKYKSKRLSSPEKDIRCILRIQLHVSLTSRRNSLEKRSLCNSVCFNLFHINSTFEKKSESLSIDMRTKDKIYCLSALSAWFNFSFLFQGTIRRISTLWSSMWTCKLNKVFMTVKVIWQFWNCEYKINTVLVMPVENFC